MGPDGSTYFVSDEYPGSATDTDVVEACGILDLLRRLRDEALEMGRDLKQRPLRVLADRGFSLQGLIDTIVGPGIECSLRTKSV
jgi:hypothetical protein